MRPALLLDLEERALVAAVQAEDGRRIGLDLAPVGLPCSALPLGLFLDAEAAEGTAAWDLEELSGSTGSSLLVALRGFGVRGAGEVGATSCPRRLRSPLSPEAWASGPGAAARAAALALLDALLDPVFSALRERGLSPRRLPVAVAVDPALGRRGTLALIKILRRRGLGPVSTAPRPLAASLLLGQELAVERLVALWLGEEHLHLREVDLQREGQRLEVVGRCGITLRGLGWRGLARRLGQSWSDESPHDGERSTPFERALWSLLLGGAADGGARERRLTRGELDQRLAGPLGDALERDVAAAARAVPRLLGRGGVLALPLGAAFELPALGRRLSAALGLRVDDRLERLPALERALEGLARGRCWLADTPGRQVSWREANSLRLDTLRQGTVELLPSGALPAQRGTRCGLRQVVLIRGADGNAEPPPLRWRWGGDGDPAGCSAVACLPIPGGALAGGEERLKLELTVHRRRYGSGFVAGTRLEGQSGPKLRFHLPEGGTLRL